jgi:urease accessory protein
MVTFTRIVGSLSEADIASRIHALSHDDKVEVLRLEGDNTLRRRLRGLTDKGTEVIIALDRSEQLTDGAVLCLDPERAIVVRLQEERWLRIEPRDADAALEAGYFAGNLHWRVHFEPGALLTSSGKVVARLP